MKKGLSALLLASLLCASSGCQQNQKEVVNEYNIVPMPNQMTPQEGRFLLSNKVSVVTAGCTPEVQAIADSLIAQIQLTSGISLKTSSQENPEQPDIRFVTEEGMPKEGYKLSIAPNEITLSASHPNGFFYGVQTMYQLLPPAIYGKATMKRANWSLPAVEVEDAPRFPYRGLMLDVCRHFSTTDYIYKFIDMLAMHKMNTFHFHLTDDQGWRIEIKKYPKLTTVGGYRKKTIVGYMWDNPTEWNTKRYGGFYTQEDIKEVVAYAKKRFVEIIPEIEMPGHSVAALTAYPEYSCTGGPFEVEGRWGVFNDIYCTKESTFTFMQDILDEVVELFPSSYIHLGGDEAPRIRWKNCVHCQERMKQEHLTKEAELQTYFINRIENYLNTKGKKIIGWDEILEGGILQRATVMSWRGEKGGIHAAKAGYDVIMSPNIYMYFNCLQSKVNEKKIGNPNRVITLEKVYNYHPVPEVLSADEAKHIKGVQANLWTEYMSALDEMEYMLYPRVAALSEVAWSKKENKDYGRFCTRLESIRRHYDVLGVNYCKKISNE